MSSVVPSKRVHSSLATSSPVSTLPELPRTILGVSAHKSPHHAHIHAGCCGERLSELGGQVLELAVTHALFHRKPLLTAKQMVAKTKEILSDANVEYWVTKYQLRQKVRCHPDAVSPLQILEEPRLLFNSYVGVLYVEGGFERIQTWISCLANSGAITTEPVPQSPPSKRIKTEGDQASPIMSLTSTHLVAPDVLTAMGSSASQDAPYLRRTPKPPNPLAPAQPNSPFLPMFNEAVNQRRAVVEYTYSFSGPSHAGMWTVTCIVNGIPKGTGHGKSKQIAKEEAARHAFHKMGWAPYG